MSFDPYYYAPDQRCLFRVHASVAIVDREGRVLLVQEAKKESRQKWNLPGGHIDHGEPISDGAARETREETGIDAKLLGLVGIYSGPVSVRFVFRAHADGTTAHAGDEILAVKWMPLDELLVTPVEQLVSPANLLRIARDLKSETLYPLSMISPAPK